MAIIEGVGTFLDPVIGAGVIVRAAWRAFGAEPVLRGVG